MGRTPPTQRPAGYGFADPQVRRYIDRLSLTLRKFEERFRKLEGTVFPTEFPEDFTRSTQGGFTEPSAAEQSPQMGNSSGITLPAGSLLYGYGGTIGLAIANSSSTRAEFATDRNVSQTGVLFPLAFKDVIRLVTTGDGDIVAGDILWLSDDTAGAVQRDIPTSSGSYRQHVAYAMRGEENGTVLARNLMCIPSVSVRVN